MDRRERILAACSRVGLRSQVAIAKACGVTQPAVFALLSGSSPMHDLLDKIAEETGASANWLRQGLPCDAPGWAVDPVLIAMNDAEEAVRRLTAMREERDQALVERDAARAELALANAALAKLALRMASAPSEEVPSPRPRRAAGSSTVEAVRAARARRVDQQPAEGARSHARD